MSLVSDLAPFFRTLWAGRMVDSVLVRRITGETLNTTSGALVATYSTTYSGAALARPKMASDAIAGGQQHELRMYDVYVPHTVTTAQPDDEVVVTSSDGWLTGRTLVVRNIEGDSYNHHRLLVCEDNQGG